MKHLSIFLSVLLLGVISQATQAEKAIFAGGCFWCTESDFEKLEGVNSAVSGYTGGHVQNPTYKQVSHTDTGHHEAVEVDFNPSKISYSQLLDHYWTTIDPFDHQGQFCDKGSSYLSAIFPLNDEQMKLAKKSKEKVQQQFGKDRPVATQIIAASTFYPAENYHQDYYKTNPIRYKFYRWNCGRDHRLKEIWGDKIKLPDNPHNKY